MPKPLCACGLPDYRHPVRDPERGLECETYTPKAKAPAKVAKGRRNKKRGYESERRTIKTLRAMRDARWHRPDFLAGRCLECTHWGDEHDGKTGRCLATAVYPPGSFKLGGSTVTVMETYSTACPCGNYRAPFSGQNKKRKAVPQVITKSMAEAMRTKDPWSTAIVRIEGEGGPGRSPEAYIVVREEDFVDLSGELR